MPYTSRTSVLNLRDVTVFPADNGPAWPSDEVAIRLADGRIVIAWSGSQYGDNDVRFQILNEAGAPLTEPASVFGVETTYRLPVSITLLADGGFAIRGGGVIQRYDSLGVENGPAIALPANAQGHVDFLGGEISALGEGFVTASARTPGPGGNHVILSFYGADSTLQSQQTIAGVHWTDDVQLSVRQGADAASTRIVAVWTELIPVLSPRATPGSHVWLQVMDGAGHAIGVKLMLDARTLFSVQPDVAFLADGSFVVSWIYSDTSAYGVGPSLNLIHTQHFSSDGVALNAASPVSGPVSGSLSSSITPLADGGYLLTWTSGGVGHAQQFDAQSARVGVETTFVTGANGGVLLSDGRVLVVGGLQYEILSPNINVQSGDGGNNAFQGGAGDDTYDGQAGNDTIRGGAGSDLLIGAGGDDFLYGEAGNDILVGGAGNDVIDGGEGYDLLRLDRTLGDYFIQRTQTGYRIWDGAGYDDVTHVEGVLVGGTLYDIAEFAGVSFNALAYIAGYADLADGYGADALAGYQHYVQHGRAEGRTVVFDPVSYLAANYDLAVGYGDDPVAAAWHFIEHGRFEGRQTGGFGALIYGASNPDLARIYGTDVEALTRHFVEHGARDGRPLSGFDALLYGATHADLARGYGADATALLNHYLTNGADEGRAAGGFDSVAYLLTYSDLAGIGGRGALLHWLTNGADERRVGDALFGREQGAAHGLTGGTAQAALEQAGDHDWFQFDLVGGTVATLRLSGVTTGGGTLTDGWLRLYDEAGVLVATNRGPGGTSDAEIVFQPTASGRYYLVVAGETDSQTGTYRVTVTSGAEPVAASASDDAAVLGVDVMGDAGWHDPVDRWLSGAAHLQPTPDHDWAV